MARKKESKFSIATLIVAWLTVKITKETLRNKGIIK